MAPSKGLDSDKRPVDERVRRVAAEGSKDLGVCQSDFMDDTPNESWVLAVAIGSFINDYCNPVGGVSRTEIILRTLR